MKLLLIDSKQGRQLLIGAGALWLCLVGFVATFGAVGYFGYQLGVDSVGITSERVRYWQDKLISQQKVVEKVRIDAEQELSSSAKKMAEMQAKLVRLDALAARLVKDFSLDDKLFNFHRSPALGGPASSGDSPSFEPPTYMGLINNITFDIQQQERQFDSLEKLFNSMGSSLEGASFPKPLSNGWVSSGFGYRSDPFTGKRSWHGGVDYAGREGTEVNAVSEGLVVFAGWRTGYGLMVDIRHGGGFMTRYGHLKQMLVKVGEEVGKGEPVGLLGSTGRATGPHVHFEVIKNGRQVNPTNYVRRTKP